MDEKEVIEQLESLIEAWQLDEADLNQTDINAMKTLLKENEQLKYNWNELKKWLRIKDILANSKINPQSIKFKDLLKHMEYLEKER